jgi:hypothetical protein
VHRVSLILLRNCLSILVLVGCLGQASADNYANKKIEICSDDASKFAKFKDKETYIFNIFRETALSPELIFTPVKRAEASFKSGKCDGFFASTVNFAKELELQEVFYIPEKVESVKVKIFANASPRCTSKESCLLAAKPTNLMIGVFRSHELLTHIRSFSTATIIEINKTEQGIQMLRQNKLDALVIPDIYTESNTLYEIDTLAAIEFFFCGYTMTI